ncbi:hypothetical protein TVAG_291110 [Trichomonas vaginalis G3]|uniref:Leucine Rich Repeat family protein n=1 Tax=Trichomonas vaginalis (strain ATCC PRA-98 / G3) TaxID=412133 RepID=A2F3Y9_TRIV3|nr:leucine-rich repeat, isoform f-related family [Trichomonas vaginalis G3]EAY00405.1 hypothetical protein TVAG_291110 [Trichomonas vaginalis G3]KAI5528373.1 leucine-rich repeat, isoform f-related family [Trichomonas vaginalis G3]|eukprot:XP_001313334.1 hypothetical protein [Trichomonas vaginalis G3]
MESNQPKPGTYQYYINMVRRSMGDMDSNIYMTSVRSFKKFYEKQFTQSENSGNGRYKIDEALSEISIKQLNNPPLTLILENIICQVKDHEKQYKAYKICQDLQNIPPDKNALTWDLFQKILNWASIPLKDSFAKIIEDFVSKCISWLNSADGNQKYSGFRIFNTISKYFPEFLEKDNTYYRRLIASYFKTTESEYYPLALQSLKRLMDYDFDIHKEIIQFLCKPFKSGKTEQFPGVCMALWMILQRYREDISYFSINTLPSDTLFGKDITAKISTLYTLPILVIVSPDLFNNEINSNIIKTFAHLFKKKDLITNDTIYNFSCFIFHAKILKNDEILMNIKKCRKEILEYPDSPETSSALLACDIFLQDLIESDIPKIYSQVHSLILSYSLKNFLNACPSYSESVIRNVITYSNKILLKFSTPAKKTVGIFNFLIDLNIPSKKILPDLILQYSDHLSAHSRLVRRACYMYILKYNKENPSTEILERIFSSIVLEQDREIRLDALSSVTFKSFDDTIIPALQQLLIDNDEEIRQKSFEIIIKLASYQTIPPIISSVLTDRINSLQNSSENFRENILFFNMIANAAFCDPPHSFSDNCSQIFIPFSQKLIQILFSIKNRLDSTSIHLLSHVITISSDEINIETLVKIIEDSLLTNSSTSRLNSTLELMYAAIKYTSLKTNLQETYPTLIEKFNAVKHMTKPNYDTQILLKVSNLIDKPKMAGQNAENEKSDIISSEDSKLPKEEIEKLVTLVPRSQNTIFMIFKMDFRINKRRLMHGICILTEHLILVVRKAYVTGSYTVFEQFFIMQIKKIKISHDQKVTLVFPESRLSIMTNYSNRFVEILSRNYLLCTCNIPSVLKCKVSMPEGFDLPHFRPVLSVSQKFQFSYTSYCTVLKTHYNHDLVKFFHKIICEGNVFVNFSELPFQDIDVFFGNPVNLEPVLKAMTYAPLIYGHIIQDVSRPDFLKLISPVIAKNKSMKLLQCSNCSIREGIHELTEAMLSNDSLNIVFYDLSNNPLQELYKLAYAFSKIKNPLLYLNLSDTGMDQTETVNFMKALSVNKYLHEIRYFLIKHCKVNEDGLKYFMNYLQKMRNLQMNVLRCLDIGSIISGSGLLFNALVDFPQPIEFLSLEGSKITKKDLPSLLNYLKTTELLQEINLSDTNLSIEWCGQIIAAIEDNEKLSGFNLLLNNNGIGKNFGKFVKLFKSNRLIKWNGLSLEHNDISTTDFVDSLDWFENLTNLREFNIGGNFHKTSSKLQEALEMLFNKQTLFHIGISGTSKKHIGLNGAQIIANLMENNYNIVELDISNNHIHGEGLAKMAKMLQKNEIILDLQLDGQSPKTIDSYTKIYEILSKHPSINTCPWPRNDVDSLFSNLKTQQRMTMIRDLAAQYSLAMKRMKQNQAERGLHSHLSKLQITEVDEMIDNLTISMHQSMLNLRTRCHSTISEFFHYPYPFEDMKHEKFNREVNSEIYDQLFSKPFKTIEEPIEGEKGQLSTLQFNSLCLRRPGVEEMRKQQQQMMQQNMMNLQKANEIKREIATAPSAPINHNKFNVPSQFEFQPITDHWKIDDKFKNKSKDTSCAELDETREKIKTKDMEKTDDMTFTNINKKHKEQEYTEYDAYDDEEDYYEYTE